MWARGLVSEMGLLTRNYRNTSASESSVTSWQLLHSTCSLFVIRTLYSSEEEKQEWFMVSAGIYIYTYIQCSLHYPDPSEQAEFVLFR